VPWGALKYDPALNLIMSVAVGLKDSFDHSAVLQIEHSGALMSNEEVEFQRSRITTPRSRTAKASRASSSRLVSSL